MPTEKDQALVQFLIGSTDKGTIKWEATASDAQYVTGFKGKYDVTIARDRDRDGDTYYRLTVTNVENNREILSMTGYGGGHLGTLFDIAQRQALNVDAAIDEIMDEGEGDFLKGV